MGAITKLFILADISRVARNYRACENPTNKGLFLWLIQTQHLPAMTWNANETRDLVERHYGRQQLKLFRPPLKSVVDRQDFARYHYQEAMRLLSEFRETFLEENKLLILVCGDGVERLAFETLMTRLAAHTTACINSIHCIPDILAHVFYYALNLNQSAPLKEGDISARSVATELFKSPHAKYGEFGTVLDSLTNQPSAQHIAALSNHSKHRSVIQPLINEDLTGERAEPHEIRLSAFDYKGTRYPQIAIRDLLEPEYARSSKIVVESGELLNQVLSSKSL